MSYKDHFDKDGYIKELEGLIMYQYAYDILMEHFNKLPDWVKPRIDKQLKDLGL